MSFKGKQNLEGRPKGSANKISTKVEQTIAEILDDNLIELNRRMFIMYQMHEMKPKKQLFFH